MGKTPAAKARLTGTAVVTLLLTVPLAGCGDDDPVRNVFAPAEFDCPAGFLRAIQEDAPDDATVTEIEPAEFGFPAFADELQKGCAVVLSTPGDPDTYFGVIPAKVTPNNVIAAARDAGFEPEIIDQTTGLGQYSKDLKFDADPAAKPQGEVMDISLVSTALVPGLQGNFAGNDIAIIYVNLAG